MSTQNTPIDFIAYNPDGTVVLLAEAKSRHGTSEAWAAKLRRNMLSHGVLPPAEYFLIATPERMYGWKQENLSVGEIPTQFTPPQFTIDARKALAPYFAKLDCDPKNIGPKAFELLILSWLNEIARSAEYRAQLDASLRSLSESGLLSSLSRAQIEMNTTR